MDVGYKLDGILRGGVVLYFCCVRDIVCIELDLLTKRCWDRARRIRVGRDMSLLSRE